MQGVSALLGSHWAIRSGGPDRSPRERGLAPVRAAVVLGAALLAASGGAQPGASELVGTSEQRRALLADLTARILAREAFSPSQGADFPHQFARAAAALEPVFAEADTEPELLRALSLLSNLRRDGHLAVRLVGGGLRYSGPPDALPPVAFAVDFGTPGEELLFVAGFDEPALRRAGVETMPGLGDRLRAIDGEPVEARLRRIEPYLACSTRHRLLLELAVNVAARRADFPPELLGDAVTFELERRDGRRYEVRAPLVPVETPAWDEPLEYLESAWSGGARRFSEFAPHLATRSFTLWLPADAERKVVLLEWHGFKEGFRGDIDRLMKLASDEALLDHDVMLDLTRARGGTSAWYLLQRLVSRPFTLTRSNLRTSDASARFVEIQLAAPPRPDRQWLHDWLATEARAAIAAGRPYTASAPFKLAALPADSDGQLQPASPHFRGRLVLLVGPFSRSQNDQVAAMVADNGLGRLVGMPTAGTSNSWEWIEPITLPGGTREIARFMYSIGQTVRPSGEVLEGNPPAPHEPVPMTRENFEHYDDDLLRRALLGLEREQPP